MLANQETLFKFKFEGKEYELRVWATSALHLGFDAGLAPSANGLKSEPAVINGVAYTMRFDAERPDWSTPWAFNTNKMGQFYAGFGGPIYMVRANWPRSGPREPTENARRKAPDFARAALTAFLASEGYCNLIMAGEKEAARLELARTKKALDEAVKAAHAAQDAYLAARRQAEQAGIDPNS